MLECSLIKRHKPKYNILLKDDKGYPYVRLNLNAGLSPLFCGQRARRRTGPAISAPIGSRGSTRMRLSDAVSLRPAPAHLQKAVSPGHRQGAALPQLTIMGNCDGWCRPEMTEEAYRERIAQAVQLLEGDFAAVEQQLRRADGVRCRGAALRGGGGATATASRRSSCWAPGRR